MIDWIQYRENYPDLNHFTTQQELENHWKNHGIHEHRTYQCLQPRPMKPVLVSIVHDEAFIQHHVGIGFDTLYLYGDSTSQHERVVVIPGIQSMSAAFYHFAHTYMQKCTHVAYTDTYIQVPSIQEFIETHVKTDTNDVSVAGVQWKDATIVNVKYYNSFTLNS